MRKNTKLKKKGSVKSYTNDDDGPTINMEIFCRIVR